MVALFLTQNHSHTCYLIPSVTVQDLVAPAPRELQPIITTASVAVTQDAPGGAGAAAGGGNGGAAADPLADALQPGVGGGRPLRVLVSDCRVLVDRAGRDAVWGAGEAVACRAG
jgi:hypothetical protein